YLDNMRRGHIGFVSEYYNDYLPRWVGSRAGEFVEILADGPHRVLQKSGFQNVPVNSTWNNVGGWETIDTFRKPYGNTGVTLSGGGFVFNHTGRWEVEVFLGFTGGNNGSRSVRIQGMSQGGTYFVGDNPNPGGRNTQAHARFIRRFNAG